MTNIDEGDDHWVVYDRDCHTVYEGPLMTDKHVATGKGAMFFQGGIVFKGSFHEGLIHGKGILSVLQDNNTHSSFDIVATAGRLQDHAGDRLADNAEWKLATQTAGLLRERT